MSRQRNFTKNKPRPFSEIDLVLKGQHDPRWFLEDCCGVKLWEKQIEIAQNLVHHNVAVPAVFGVGKTYVASWITLWWLYTHPLSQVVTTAPTGRQVKDQLWAEIRSAYHASKLPLGGELLTTELRVHPKFPKWFATGFATNEEHIDKFTGYHAVAGTLLIFDQACGIHKQIWTAGEGLVTTHGSRWLALTNTTDEESEMANLCMPDRRSDHGHTCEDPECKGCGGWKIMKITAHDSPNVKAGANVVPGVIAHDYVEKKRKVWRIGDPMWEIYIEANFVVAGAMTVLHPTMVREVLEKNNVEPDWDNIVLGVDIGDEGTDPTVAFAFAGLRLLTADKFLGNDTMMSVRFIQKFYDQIVRLASLRAGREVKPIDIRVDKIGVGKGVVDRLSQLEYPTTGVNVGTAAYNDDDFLNRRIEMAWKIREHAEARILDLRPIFSTDEEILERLREDMSIRYVPLPSQKIKLEDKKDYRRRQGRSCDYWDAMMLAIGDEVGAPGVSAIDYQKEAKRKVELVESFDNLDPIQAQDQLEAYGKMFGMGILEEEDFVNHRLL